MKSTRRLLSLVLCLVMCLSLLPTSAFAASIMSSGQAGAGLEFVLYTNGKLVISGNGTVAAMEQWSFSTGGYTTLNDAIMATRSETKVLVLESGVQGIAAGAFQDCRNLSSVSFPYSMTQIGNNAFRNCSALTEVYIPGNILTIGDSAFRNCVNLVWVTLANGVQNVNANAFRDCTKLPSILFPASIQAIGANAFGSCGSLKVIEFEGNYTGALLNANSFTGVTATATYPVDNNTWNQNLRANAAYPDFGGRLTWKASTAPSESNGWVQKNGAWYYYMNGEMLTSNWKAFEGRWFYFGANGQMYTGRQQIDGDYYYFGTNTAADNFAPLGARMSGWVNGEYYDQNGVWQPAFSGVDDNTAINLTYGGIGLEYMRKGWQQLQDTGTGMTNWYYVRDGKKVTGWLKSNKLWYYLDPTTGAMVTGWLTWQGKTYYLRPLAKAQADGFPEGSMVAGRSTVIGDPANPANQSVYTFDKSGALQGGRQDQNPLNAATGFRNEGSAGVPKYVFYRSDGSKAYGWEKIDSYWYYFDPKTGYMQTGWKQIGGQWYYLTKWAWDGTDPETDVNNWFEITDPVATYANFYAAGRMVTEFNTIPYTKNNINSVKTYFFKKNGALNGNGWIKVDLKWYYLEADGTVHTGWLRDGNKWYYLRDDTFPVGEMVTGSFNVPATLATGEPNNPSGMQSFKSNGAWIGDGDKTYKSNGGEWKKHNNLWYYYNADGDDYPVNANALTGWQWIDNKWYYLDPTSAPQGRMLTGWQDVDGDGRQYYLNKSGELLTGWQKIDGVWYYLNPEKDGTLGKQMKGWKKIKDRWYYLDDVTGAVQDGWFEVKSGSTGEAQGFAIGWYYLNSDQNSDTYGAMMKGGWHKINDKWYYFHNEHDGAYGKLEQGKWIQTDGKWYYVKASTNPAESWMVTGMAYVEADGRYYYFGSDGAWQKPTGWKKINEKWYYFDSVDHYAVTGWVNDGGERYYLNEKGIMQTGWQTIGGDEYYFDKNGHMLHDTTIGGKTLGPDGKVV